MTFVAKSSDAFEALQEMRDRLTALIELEEDRAKKLEAERVALEARIAIANAQALLTKLLRQSTVTEGDKAAIKGVKEQLARVA